MPLGDANAYTPSVYHPVRVRARMMPADTHLKPHSHDWGQLVYCRAGVVQAFAEAPDGTGQTTFVVPPARALWIAPAIRHAVTALEAAQLQTVYIHATASPVGDCAWRVIVVSDLLRELIPALDHAARDDGEAPRAVLLGQLVLDEIHRAPSLTLGVPMPHPDEGDKRLRALCQAVLQHPADRATLAHGARSVGASERTAARLFREELRTSYQQCRQQLALSHALPMLATGESVAQVAAACGYASESAFGAMFKAALGHSPGAMRF